MPHAPPARPDDTLNPPPRKSARILICDELAPESMAAFREHGFEPELRTGLKGAALLEAVREVDAIVVRSATRITREVIEAAERVKVIGRAGIGVDNIDLEAATERGIVVMNTPFGNATTTAELALALLFAVARHLPRADRQVRAGRWEKKSLLGTEITGKTLGVIGLGRIGRQVAERARGLGMEVVAFDPYLDQASSPPGTPDLLELPELLGRADFITVHVPLTAGTRNLLSWKELALVKPGARLIQASRGGIVDEEAVLDALQSGRLAGAAFDVFAEEPPRPDHPLLLRDDVIATPHLGASSREAQIRVAVEIAQQVAEFLGTGVARHAVNAPTVAAESMHSLAPFLVLAEKLGSFLAQRLDGPIRKVELTVAGEVAKHGIQHLRLAFLVGVLRHSLGSGVNFVNAPILAKERGIFVLENTEADATYVQGELRVTASQRGGGETHYAAGAVFGREPRITHVDEVRLDLPPRGHLLITQHQDRPGIIGRIGTVLGDHAINIQRLELGPPQGDSLGPAYGFLTIQGTGPDAGLEDQEEWLGRLRAIDGIDLVQLIEL